MASGLTLKINTQSALLERIRNAYLRLPQPGVSVSAYDTGWLSRVQRSDGRPHFPSALEWVVNNQKEDGGWGSDIEYYHDRIISTVSCLLALKQYNSDRTYQERIDRGENYICSNIHNVIREKESTVGFELLFPRLMEDLWAQDVCLSCEYSPVAEFMKKREDKLQMLEKYVYLKTTTLLHSLEFFNEKNLNFEKILTFQARNGSFLNSPSATAFVYMHTHNHKALQYLEEVANVFGGVAPVNYPLDIFRANWILNDIFDLQLESHLQHEVSALMRFLREHWTEKGMSWSKEFNLPDVDNTATATSNFIRAGVAVSENALKNFFDGKRFFCFEGEIHTGPSHIANVLKALHLLPQSDFVLQAKRACVKELMFLRKENGLWRDKWHYSELYVTSRVYFAIQSRSIKEEIVRAFKLRAETGVSDAEQFFIEKVLFDAGENVTVRSYKQDPKLWIDKVLYDVEL